MKRSAKRPRFDPADRWLWVILSKWWTEWPKALEIMQADTVRRWRRQGIWHHLKRRRGRRRPGRPPIASETRDLIREMSRDNRLWGAPRVRGELLKLGIKVSQTTVAKYMDRRPGPPSPTWRAFWRMHAPDLPVTEVYAELAGRFRAVSTGIFRLLPTLCEWLWVWISGWWSRKKRRQVQLTTQSSNHDMAPVGQPLRGVDLVWAFGRSPPDSLSLSIDPAMPLYPSIVMGRADVRPVSLMRDGWEAPQAICALPAINNRQRLDVSQQAAA